MDDLQPCPVCQQRREVLYTWRAGVMRCWCLTCGAVFAPLRRRVARAHESEVARG